MCRFLFCLHVRRITRQMDSAHVVAMMTTVIMIVSGKHAVNDDVCHCHNDNNHRQLVLGCRILGGMECAACCRKLRRWRCVCVRV